MSNSSLTRPSVRRQIGDAGEGSDVLSPSISPIDHIAGDDVEHRRRPEVLTVGRDARPRAGRRTTAASARSRSRSREVGEVAGASSGTFIALATRLARRHLHRQVAQQVARGERRRPRPSAGPSGANSTDRQLGVDRLFGRTLPSPKSKKVCQSMNRRGARQPPRRSAGSLGFGSPGRRRGRRTAGSGRWRSCRSWRGSSDGPGSGRTGRRRRRTRPGCTGRCASCRGAPVGQRSSAAARADRLRQELVEHHPLVVPADDALGLGEHLLGRCRLAPRSAGDVGDDAVVEAQEGERGAATR